jgi:hypothetical protein
MLHQDIQIAFASGGGHDGILPVFGKFLFVKSGRIIHTAVEGCKGFWEAVYCRSAEKVVGFKERKVKQWQR